MLKIALSKIDSLETFTLAGEPIAWNLPLSLCCGLTLEDVSAMITPDTFAWVRNDLSKHDEALLRGIRHALVYRYEGDSLSDETDHKARQLIDKAAACLRIIRPMRESVSFLRGRINTDGTLEAESFAHPRSIVEVPEVQKLYDLRLQDATQLGNILPAFLAIYSTDIVKLKMAVEFNQAAHFQDIYWKARFLLRCSALEALFTTGNRDNNGSLVAKERVKWFLGANEDIYETEDIPDYLPRPNITVAYIVEPIYQIRNHIAHGSRIPDKFFDEKLRRGLNSGLSIAVVADEGLSFIVRRSILKILSESLESHFLTPARNDACFASFGLTKTALDPRGRGLS